jgi:hypothetical protein|nr:MAG TPA: hypothetical protein [Caudoviricetes sp.]
MIMLEEPRCIKEGWVILNDKEEWTLKPDSPSWAKKEFEEFMKAVNPTPVDGVITHY